MIRIKGLYNAAVVYAQQCEESAGQELERLCGMPYSKNWKIRVMPDVHYCGISCVNGLTVRFDEGEGGIPYTLLGFDIGCGVHVVRLKEREIDLDALHRAVLRRIPCFPMQRAKPHPLAEALPWDRLRCGDAVPKEEVICKVGMLVTGGNHFIELDRGEDGALYLVVHAGCVSASKPATRYYCDRLGEAMGTPVATASYEEREVVARTALTGRLLEEYLNDIGILEEIAVAARQIMLDDVCEEMGLTVEERFDTAHNTIDRENRILRKGAVSAQKGERLYIPMNMRDGGFICVGKGNEEWNFSAPHGAGRLMWRKQARAMIAVEDYRREIRNVYVPDMGMDAVDEAPQAYKPMEEIAQAMRETVDIVEHIVPLYNFKRAF